MIQNDLPFKMAENAVDTLAEDSIAATEPVYGIILEPQEAENFELKPTVDTGLSFILLALFVIFCVIAFRFNNNRKFLGALMRNLVEVKERQNVFDDTVRETSFLVFLNVMWCATSGVILFRLLQYHSPDGMNFLFSTSACMALCMAITVGYTVFMCTAYITAGNVFSDALHTKMWIKGFAASQGVMGMFYFPLSLACICYPDLTGGLLWAAAITFILAKSVFICKGLRIFFTQFSSWVLFLYYLCSLELVPLILTYFTADLICRN